MEEDGDVGEENGAGEDGGDGVVFVGRKDRRRRMTSSEPLLGQTPKLKVTVGFFITFGDI